MRKTNGLIFLLALIKFILPYLLQNSYYEPHRDEFLYLAQGHHLAWGFAEVPPMLSIFAWLTHLFGDGMFWIKFWPNMFGVLTFIVSCQNYSKAGWWLVCHFPGISPLCFRRLPSAVLFISTQYTRSFFLDDDCV